MTEAQSPVLVIATVDAESRGILERELRVRYGSEYTVVVRGDYATAHRSRGPGADRLRAGLLQPG